MTPIGLVVALGMPVVSAVVVARMLRRTHPARALSLGLVAAIVAVAARPCVEVAAAWSLDVLHDAHLTRRAELACECCDDTDG